MKLKGRFQLEPWQTSLLIHLGATLGLTALIWMPQVPKDVVQIEIVDIASEVSKAPIIQGTKKENDIKKDKDKPRAVYGTASKFTTKERSKKNEGPSIKRGNTIAKESDNLRLRPEDEGRLPIPTEDYLVTSMPVLREEYRIPYPAEAKKKNIQGVVVMDLLIDRFGKVRDAQLISGPGSGLNKAALEAVLQFQFQPASIQDQSVAVKIRYGYRFILE